MAASFPIGSSVLLQNLVKGAHLNDQKGIVKSRPNASGRQEVYIFEAKRSLAVKPANLRYEPRELSSLSISEMKGVLRLARKLDEDDEPKEWSGMGEGELRALAAAEVATEDPGEIAALVAKANEPTEPPQGGGAAAAPPLQSREALRQGAERMAQMTPEGIRQQAATMKAMGPAALRAMNPQMAAMSDDQINMAIAQMEAVANNPSQLKMAADQMKTMSDSELQQAVNQSPLAGQPPPTPAAASATASAAPSLKNVSKSQFQQATQQMSSMTPEQFRQQANMMKSMPLDTLRRTNPQMANMTDAQIQMSIAQLEQMADNPHMMKMAADQMKNMSEDQFEGMKNMMNGLTGALAPSGSAAASGENNGAAATPAGLTDPSKIMEALLSSPEQLNAVIKTMKKNPDMLKQMLASSMGGAGESGSNPRREQMEKAIDSFAEMDEVQLERYLKMANRVQSVAKPVLSTFEKAKSTLGVSTKTLAILINVMILAGFVLLLRWWKLRNGGNMADEIEINILAQEEPEIAGGGYDSEF